MTHVISFYSGNILHMFFKKKSVPWWRVWHMFCQLIMKNHTCDKTSLVRCLQTFAQKKVQYHNALSHFILGISHRNYQKSSVPWCRVWHMLFHFIMENPHKWPKKNRYHDAVNHTCDNTSLVKCLQTFATELDAIMCLMSKTEQFESGPKNVI